MHVLLLTLWSRLQLFVRNTDEKMSCKLFFVWESIKKNLGPHKTRKNLGLGAVKWKTVSKVGVAPLRPACLQMRNISPRRCPNPLRYLVKTRTCPFRTRNIATLHFQQNFSRAYASNSKNSTDRSRTSASTLVV
jgi:hypothetical protein